MIDMKRLKQILPFLFLFTLILSALHYFIFVNSAESLNHFGHQYETYFGWLLTSGVVIILAGFLSTLTPFKSQMKPVAYAGYLWMGLFHFLFFLSLIDFIFKIFYFHNNSYILILLGFLLFLTALYFGLRFPKVYNHEVKANLTDEISVVQISDLHIGMLHLNQYWLEKIVNKINALDSDYVVITGDLVEGPYQEVAPQLEVLKNLKAKKKKFYITGNHEYIHETESWENLLESFGFHVLHNSHVIEEIGDKKIMFAGVPDRMVNRFKSNLKSIPDKALKNSMQIDYKILLAHEPASVWDLKEETCDLILSGHTHGGQIFPFNFFVRMAQPVVKGFKTINGVRVFAHQGTGFWGPPLRFFSRSEIVVFKIK